MDNYKKTFKLSIKKEFRRKIFVENVKVIIEHNKQYDLGLTSFMMDVNKFTHLENYEFKQLKTGLNFSKSNVNLTSFFPKVIKRDLILLNKDWRTENKVSPVQDQGHCGSCWAFSTVTTLESNYAIKYNKYLDLSIQELLDCSSYSNGCSGGDLGDAFEYVRKRGLSLRRDYPSYKAIKGFCWSNFLTKKYLKKVQYKIYFEDANEHYIQYLVYKYGPISVGINANNKSFVFYSEGIYDDLTCAKTINHAVTIVGYGEENNRKFWIVKNSWDKHWGENGYIRIIRGKNICGIETYGVFLI